MTDRKRYLVTGGAGFIGSHAVLALRDRGAEVVVIDNLSTGHRAALPPDVPLHVLDLKDRRALHEVVADGPWDAVLHFAALSIASDSMREPFRYFEENVSGGIALITECLAADVRKFVFSSTANLFGLPDVVPIPDDAAIRPSSPYGETKHILELMLRWADEQGGMRHACLRYFNAAGADPDGRAGEDHTPETHLIPSAIDAALGLRDRLTIFGEDYPTPDGTCIRDYIHVSDLAAAHLAVLTLLDRRSVRMNVGVGRGYSVRQAIDAVARVTGRAVPTQPGERRAGDPTALVAAADRLRDATGWAPKLNDIDHIVATAHAWRAAHPGGYRGR